MSERICHVDTGLEAAIERKAELAREHVVAELPPERRALARQHELTVARLRSEGKTVSEIRAALKA